MGNLPDIKDLTYATNTLRTLYNIRCRVILKCVMEHGPINVGDIVLHTDRWDQPTVSQQLTRLRNAGVVKAKRRGQHIFYRCDMNRIEQIDTAIHRFV